MRIRRPVAVLLTSLALFGGGATLTACQGGTSQTGTDREPVEELAPEEADRENMPDTSDAEPGADTDGGGEQSSG